MQPRVHGKGEPGILRNHQNDLPGPANGGKRSGQLCAEGGIWLTEDDARKPFRKQSRERERIRQTLGIRKKPKRRHGGRVLRLPAGASLFLARLDGCCPGAEFGVHDRILPGYRC